MTLPARNNCFKGGIILAALSLGLVAAGGYFTFSVFPDVSESAALRSGGIILKLAENLSEPSANVPFLTMLAAVVYSLVSIILIYYFFEQTQSPEIVCIGFFAASLAFELIRLAIPLKEAFPFSAMYVVVATQILLFGRYFGLLSLFAASVYAAGLDSQKQHNIFLIFAMVTLIIVLNIPIDSLSWDSSFKLLNGYRSMFAVAEMGLLSITVFTFIVSAYIRGSRSYIFIGVGTLMLFFGRDTLVYSDNWITPGLGLALLVAGTWIVCSRLHKEYLWH